MFKRAIIWAAVAAFLLHTTGAWAQASQIQPGKVCFQATTGISGMVGSLGPITGGSGGVNGTYGGVALTGGSGSSATANIVVSGGAVTSVTLLNPGVRYIVGDALSAASGNIGGVTGFSVLVASTAINSSLAGGAVGMYIPGTLTTKQTWMDAGQVVLNTNPVQLDLNGCALMYGTGVYRQIIYDNLGNQVWDQLTTVFAPNPIYSGLAGGTANAITVTDSAFSGTDGQAISFIASATNTGAVTINPSGYGAISVVKNTASGPVALTGGEIVGGTPGNLYTVTYSSVYNEFFLPVPATTGGGGGTSIPSGAVMAFALTACPTGWVNANGSGGTVNMLGVVARGYDPTNSRDPNGSSQSIGSYESDMYQQHTEAAPSGASFYISPGGLDIGISTSVYTFGTTGSTGLSNSGNYGPETRAKSTILLYCQKS